MRAAKLVPTCDGLNRQDNRDAVALIALGTLARLPPAMIFIALLFRADELTRSFAIAGLISGIYVAARAIAAPWLGRLVDRFGQTRVLVSTALAEAALLLVVAAAPHATPVIVLVLLAAGVGSARPPLSGCVRALLPHVVSDAATLRRAYALESTAFELTFILGPPLAIAIASLWSTSGALIVCAVLLFGATGLFVMQPASRNWVPIRKASGYGGATRSAGIQTFIVVLGMVGGVFGVVDVALPAAMKALHDTAAAGLMLGLWGLGSLLGGVLVTRFFKSLLDGPRGLITLLVLLAILHGSLTGATRSVALMSVLVTLAGATIAPTYTNIYSAVDSLVPRGAATEAFSWLESAVTGGSAAGAALAGVLAQHFGADRAFLAAAAFGLAAVVATLARITTIRLPGDTRPSRFGATSAEPSAPPIN